MNSQSLKWRVPLVALIVAGALYYAVPPFDTTWNGQKKQGKIKLGLDLQGGIHLTLRVETEKLKPEDRHDAVARAMEIVRNRIDQFGVAEPSIQLEGTDRIIVQLPGITDRKRALDLVGKTALLEFKLVSNQQQVLSDAIAGKSIPGAHLYKDEDGKDLLLEDETLMTGKAVVNARVDFGQYGTPVVDLEFDPEGAKSFAQITGANVGRRLAIVLDGKIQSAPVINEQIPSGRAQISGSFNSEQAQDLAISLRAGALPAPIVVENDQAVGPTLGKDSVEQGIRATWIGFALVVGFMAVYYLFAGVVADLALFLNILIVLAFMSYFKGTLTLPGIAGIVLTIGMSVDANVLIFERIREELALKKPIASSVTAGYHKAWSAILDSNLTTLITAGILYYMGSGPVRGFALTLAIGLVASMFTGIFVTRVLFDMMLSRNAIKNLPMLQFLPKTPNIDFLKVRKICYAVSLAVIAWGVFAIVQRGEKSFGVDFAGGSMQEFRFVQAVSVDEVRKSLSDLGLGSATIQKIGDESRFMIRSPQNTGVQIEEKLKADFAARGPELLRAENVGPVIGKEMKSKALWAFVLSLVAIWAYVVYRFDSHFAAGAILALVHDGLVAAGFVAITGRELSVGVLAAILTILGYSINDTIVIFDRIRERRRLGSRETFAQTINLSVNQTLSRTILTTLTVLMVVGSLFLFGGEVINDFAFTMLVGLISGTYSTVYIAAPVLVDWPSKRK